MSVRNVFKTVPVAFRSLMQHKLRSALSVSGIVCGVIAFLAMISLGEGAKKKIIHQIEQLGTRNIYIRAVPLTDDQQAIAAERLSDGLSVFDADRIRIGCPYVKDVGYLKEINESVSGLSEGASPQIVAVSNNYAELLNLFVSKGRFIAASDVANHHQICVLGDTASRSAGLESVIGTRIRIGYHLYQIVGILNRFDRDVQDSPVTFRNFNEMICIPFTCAPNLLAPKAEKSRAKVSELSEIVVQIDRTDHVIKAGEIIRRIMEVSHHGIDDYQLIIPQELLLQAKKTQQTLNVVMGAIAGMSLLVGGIGIMNIMLASVSERTKEIGIRRAVGASRIDIIIHFLTESVILTGCGGVVGVAAGTTVVLLVSKFGKWNAAVTPFSIIIPLAMALASGVFFGLYPAYRAAMMDPAAALRHE